MNVIDRYIGRTILSACLSVMMVILLLNALIAFIDELGGKVGDYQTVNVLIYVLHTLPREIVDFVPMTIMIGCLVGMGVLANHSELTVMRAAGVSTQRILLAVFKPVVFLLVVIMLIAEFAAPHFDQKGEAYKAELKFQQQRLGGQNGAWLREGNTYLRVNAVQPGGVLVGVTYFQFDDVHQLTETGSAQFAHYQQGEWLLENARVTFFDPESTRIEVLKHKQWKVTLDPDLMRVLAQEPNTMSIRGLNKYIDYLAQQNIDATTFELALWQKLLLPAAILGLVLIAMSTLFGPLRSVSMGQRILVGFMAGMLFKIVQDLLGPAASVYNWSPFISALVPVLLCLIAGGWMLRRAS